MVVTEMQIGRDVKVAEGQHGDTTLVLKDLTGLLAEQLFCGDGVVLLVPGDGTYLADVTDTRPERGEITLEVW